VRSALRLAGRFPSFASLSAGLATRLASIVSGSSGGLGGLIAFDTEIRPWLGEEAAIAFLNTQTSTAGSEVVLGVKARAAAQNFLTHNGAVPAGAVAVTNTNWGMMRDRPGAGPEWA